MQKLGLFGLFSLAGLAASAVLISGERDAIACGGCFHEQPNPQQPVVESSIVSDHRMVFALAPQQTVLWDQIRYNGDPREFAWVLPVRPGTTIELSRDEWIAALDSTTQTTIIQPQSKPLGGFRGGFGDDNNGGSGCACGSATADALAASDRGGSADAGAAQPPPVQVVSQQVVGPYETVIVRSDKPKALEAWLKDHGYAIPDSILPIIEAYTAEHLDFVALRLRPGQGVRAMQPVRIVSPGADPTLPLRMVTAGVGAKVGLTLYVISEGRYRPQNFPEAQIDEKKLVWDPTQSRSNYTELAAAVMAGGESRTWLTEFAGKPVTSGVSPRIGGGTLFDAYYGACAGRTKTGDPQSPFDAGPPDAGDPDAASDAGDIDGGAGDDAGDVDAAAGDDAGDGGGPTPANTPGSPLCTFGEELCCEFDDLEVATKAMHRSDVWLTRIRADLPVTALSQDLRLEAHPSQVTVSNVHNAALPNTSGTTARIAPVRQTHLATALAMIATALLVGRMTRRRRR